MRFRAVLSVVLAACLAAPPVADAQILRRLFGRSTASSCVDANGNGICDSDEVATATVVRRERPILGGTVTRIVESPAPASRYNRVYSSATSSGGSSSNYGAGSSSNYGAGSSGYSSSRYSEREWTPRDYEAAGMPVPPSMRGPDYSGAESAGEVSAGVCRCGPDCDCRKEADRLRDEVERLEKELETYTSKRAPTTGQVYRKAPTIEAVVRASQWAPTIASAIRTAPTLAAAATSGGTLASL